MGYDAARTTVVKDTEVQRTLTERQARWISDLRYEALPPDVVLKAKHALMDYLGVALRGSTLPQGRPARVLVDGMRSAPEATMIGGGQAAAPYAAYVNGIYGHSLEYDDGHLDCCRGGSIVIPAAMAFAEREGLGGKALLTAIVAGYQAMVWSIGPINPMILNLGWHGMKIGGVFGAAATSAVLLGLSEIQTANALAIAGSDCSGTQEYDRSGGDVKRFHAGMPARSGMQAALLAQAGLTGPLTILEGAKGIHRMFSGGAPGPVEPFWDGGFHIMRTMFKLHPVVGTAQAPIDALSRILERRPASPDRIESIRVGLVDWAVGHTAMIAHPKDMTGAQFSLAFALALRVVRGSTNVNDFADSANWRDPAILAVCDKVSAFAMETPAGANPMFALVTVRYADGRVEEEFEPIPRGFWTNPASESDLRRKFHSVTAGVLASADAERLDGLIASAETLPRMGELWEVIGAAGGARS